MFHLYHTIVTINSVCRYILYSFCLSIIVDLISFMLDSKEHFEPVYAKYPFLKEKRRYG